MAQPVAVLWPDRYEPRNCPVHVRNDLEMGAPQDHVWAWLVRATLWPTWYVNSANVQILEGGDPDLEKGTRFRWVTFGVKITSEVLEYVPGERIAYDAHAFGIDAYHAWLLLPTPKGCYVLTEETQHGWLVRFSNLFMPNRMHKFHQIWLEGLESKARSGLPPAV
ncbi:MAG: SRPBCC family protein [Anaerolineales bacterium]|jgi:hypothetical protein